MRYFLGFLLTSSSAWGVLWTGIEKCEMHSARLPQLQESYRDNFKVDHPESFGVSMQYLSNIPDSYLEHVFKKHKLVVHLAQDVPFSGCQSSACRGVTSMRGETPVSMRLKPALAEGHFGIIHEIGHVMDEYFLDHNTGYEGAVDQTYAWEKTRQQDPKIWALPHTIVQEYAAELFDSYYCSKATRARLKKDFPYSYAVAQKYLLPPID